MSERVPGGNQKRLKPDLIKPDTTDDAPNRAKRLSRRSLLIGAGASLGAGLIPATMSDALADSADVGRVKDVSERMLRLKYQRGMDDMIAARQEGLNSPEILAALEGRGENPLELITRAIDAPFLPEILRGTTYDVSELHRWYPYLIPGADEKKKWRGNGCFFDDVETILTAAHVVTGRTDEMGTRYVVPDIDVNTIRAWTDDAKHVAYDDPSLTNAMIHGQFGVVVGIDTDKEPSPLAADGNGRKTYPTIPIKVSPGLARALGQRSEPYRRLFENSFMCILPPGETSMDIDPIGALIAGDQKLNLSLHASGMSGSPFFSYQNGKYVFSGVFWGAANRSIGNETFDLGFFTGIEEVRRVLAFKKQYPTG